MTADLTPVGDAAADSGSGAAVAVVDGATSIIGPSQVTCSHCGESKPSDQYRSKFDKRDKRTYVVQPCKPCEAEYQRVRRQSTDHLAYRRGWKSEAKAKDPVKFMVQERISNWRRASSEMGVPSDLTTAFLLDLWEQQGGRCYYTAEMMVPLGGSGLNRPVPECASLGRLERHLRRGRRLVHTTRTGATQRRRRPDGGEARDVGQPTAFRLQEERARPGQGRSARSDPRLGLDSAAWTSPVAGSPTTTTHGRTAPHRRPNRKTP